MGVDRTGAERAGRQFQSELDRFAQTGAAADLDRAVQTGVRALAASRSDDPADRDITAQLFNALRGKWAPAGQAMAEFGAAIQLFGLVLAAVPAEHPDRLSLMSDLGTALLSDLGVRLRATGVRTWSLDDLNRAVEIGQQAVDGTPDGHPGRAGYLNNLGRALQARSRLTGSATDRDRAVKVGDQAVAAAADDSIRAVCLFNLSTALRLRFDQTGEQTSLERAVRVAERAAAGLPPGDPNRGLALTTLVLALQARYQSRGKRADLNRAIEKGELALTAISPQSADYAVILSDLGIARRARAELTDDQADLDRAIELSEQAVEHAPDGAKRAECLSNLGAALRARYQRDGRMSDLDTAIEMTERALAIAPAGHPDLAAFWSNLGGHLGYRSERGESPQADLERAILAGDRAIAATAEGSHEYARRLSNLSADLRASFEHTKVAAELNRAVKLAERAVAAIPGGHPERAAYLSNLGTARRALFENSGRPGNLQRAIWAAEEAVDAVSPDHPDRAGYLLNLSVALSTRYRLTGASADLDRAITAGYGGASIVAAPPRDRLRAASRSAELAAGAKRWDAAVAGYSLAVDLLPRVAQRGIGRSDQEYWLAELGGLAEQAAACCLEAGQPEKAVELWDHSRGVLLGQALDIRTDLTELRDKHPELSHEFTRLRDELTRLPGVLRTLAGETGQQDEDRRRMLAARLDQVITQIQSQPGFGEFLRPLSTGQLRPPPGDDGRVVLVNLSPIRSDALVLTSDDVLVVSLPDLTPRAAREQAAALLSALGEAAVGPDGLEQADRDESGISAVLGWLWDAVAEPVLDRLGLTKAVGAGADGPRLWWCLSGRLALLPVHGAGHHQTRPDGIARTVLDRSVSSYTPTARALAHARRVRPSGRGLHGPGQLLVVALPHTPDAGDLPGAEREADLLNRQFPGRSVVLPGERATFRSVTEALPGCRWAHFACHAESNLAEPSASRLLLSDHRQHPMTVLELNRLVLAEAELAYLSACATARTGTRLPDEAIHLASAFQLAGYRHVISTLWPIADHPAVRVAADVYAGLDPAGADGADGTPRALRDAIRRRRALARGRPSTWAAYIHSGA